MALTFSLPYLIPFLILHFYVAYRLLNSQLELYVHPRVYIYVRVGVCVFYFILYISN